ncbi:MAG TPA: ABC transporter permease [Gemmatimonadaceae bacterium]|nr:ABC transporter permease [Gemmatimonadaceae bacterium]
MSPRAWHEPPGEPTWRRYLRFVRPDPAADLDDELHDHIESTVEALVARGLTPEAARAEALRRFGDLDHVRREVRHMDQQHHRRLTRAAALDAFAHDVRYALRVLRRSPGFTLVAALSIALGVAANAAVFSVVNALLLRPIPGTTAPRLVRVYVNHHSPFDWRDLDWFRSRARSFEAIVGERTAAMVMQVDGGATERVRVGFVTSGFFDALGTRMTLGHRLGAGTGDDRDAPPAVVLSHRLWERRFGADPAIVGRTIRLAGHPVTVVGVAGPYFTSSVVGWIPDLWAPVGLTPLLGDAALEDVNSLYTTARLRPGVTRDAAEAELRVLTARLAQTDTARYARFGVRLDHVRGVNAELRAPVAAAAGFLMVLVALVLLIACANVANLLLGRAAARRTEIGVRLAIGAGRWRLVRQLLTESLVLAVVGGALGFAGSLLVTRLLAAAVPAEAQLEASFFAPDGRVLLFTGALTLATALLFGLVPALRASSPRLAPLLRRDVPSGGRQRSRLVAAQAALCVVLLAVASLFVRSLASVRGLDPGFRADGVIDVPVDASLAGVDDAAQRQLFTQLVERAAALPGVRSATLAAIVPLSGSNMETRVLPEGMTVASRFDAPRTYFNVVGPGYFETLALPLRAGRGFLATDGPDAPRVAVVSETAARRWWPGERAVGKRFRWGGVDGAEVTVVGVARDANHKMPGEDPLPFVYLPHAQEFRGEMVLQLRAASPPPALRDAIWATLRELVPTLPPPPVRAMREDMAITQLPVRLGAELAGAFGLVALLLAAVGIYGVTAYSVERRTREIGIRSALGATRQRVVRMVVMESLRTVLGGAAAGLVLALAAGLLLSRVLYGVQPFDPVVLAGVPVVIAAAAVLASLVPARRAAAVDPVTAIRTE